MISSSHRVPKIKAKGKWSFSTIRSHQETIGSRYPFFGIGGWGRSRDIVGAYVSIPSDQVALTSKPNMNLLISYMDPMSKVMALLICNKHRKSSRGHSCIMISPLHMDSTGISNKVSTSCIQQQERLSHTLSQPQRAYKNQNLSKDHKQRTFWQNCLYDSW